jgi:hypothetical protein
MVLPLLDRLIERNRFAQARIAARRIRLRTGLSNHRQTPLNLLAEGDRRYAKGGW